MLQALLHIRGPIFSHTRIYINNTFFFDAVIYSGRFFTYRTSIIQFVKLGLNLIRKGD